MRFAAPILLSAFVLAAASGPVAAVCTPSSTALCVQGRFEVDVEWVDSLGVTRAAWGESYPPPVSSDDTGYFWFTDERYIETHVRVLDGCRLNQRFWVFFASLTDVEYTLTVTDTESPATVSYVNIAGERSVVTDINALDVCPMTTLRALPASDLPAAGLARSTRVASATRGRGRGVLPPCTPGATTLCLVGDRFQVGTSWQTPSDSGDGQAFPVTSHGGAFWFYSQTNLAVVVKVVETCPAFEVHLAGPATEEYAVEVTDTRTGALWSFTNPLFSTSAVGDLTAFPRSCLFGDGFESGGVGLWTGAVGVLP